MMPRNPWRAVGRLVFLVALISGMSPLWPRVQTFAQTVSPLAIGTTALVANTGGELVMLRDGPGYDANVLTALPEGTAVDLFDGPVTAADGSVWWGVVANGQSGFMVANYLASATADVAPVVSDVGVAAPAKDAGALAAITTSDVNLRTGPSEADPVILVLPQGASVETTGGPENGFYPVSYNRQPGWTAAAYLSFQEIPSDGPPPPPLAAPVADAGIGWPFRGGLWHVIQGYNNGTHTNRSAFAQYKYSLDWARVDGETAGQAVYAPASGTIEWLDRGSGGMLINMGNGYSIAMFHVTYSGMIPGQTVERGQQVGTISGPGGDGYAATAHVDLTLWQYTDGGHVSTPFIGSNAIAGMEFPDLGGANQHMGVEVTA